MKADANVLHLGTMEDANKRTVYQYIHENGIKSCQIVMGFTVLEPGSVWNTMPCHTHGRRTEVYMYFGMDEASRVFHMMGPKEETRHVTDVVDSFGLRHGSLCFLLEHGRRESAF